jgi:hypothetical protein
MLICKPVYLFHATIFACFLFCSRFFFFWNKKQIRTLMAVLLLIKILFCYLVEAQVTVSVLYM